MERKSPGVAPAKPRPPSGAGLKLAERIIEERYGRARDLTRSERDLADVDGDGTTDAAELLLLLRIRDRFRAHDADGNGRLGPEEFAALRGRTLNEKSFRWEYDRNGVMIERDARAVPRAARVKIDRDRDGRLTRKEVLAWTRAGVRLEHKRRDLDGDGMLDLAELVRQPKGGGGRLGSHVEKPSR